MKNMFRMLNYWDIVPFHVTGIQYGSCVWRFVGQCEHCALANFIQITGLAHAGFHKWGYPKMDGL